jgi:hypothetical protein
MHFVEVMPHLEQDYRSAQLSAPSCPPNLRVEPLPLSAHTASFFRVKDVAGGAEQSTEW